MIFPIGDDQVEGGDKPIFTYLFLGLNVLAFLYMLFFSSAQDLESFYLTYGAIPAEIRSGTDWWTLFSSIFVHGGVMHLVGNMIFLWVFADNIEATIGSGRFVLFYLLGGILAGIAHVLFNQASMVPAVGASGAISAVLGAYMVMFPKSRIRVFIIFLFSSAYIPAFLFLGIWILQQTVSGVGSLGTVNLASGGVAWWAHIGGFVFGFGSGFYFRRILRHRSGSYIV
jgi:membrane associated rhomboid family serine protease